MRTKLSPSEIISATNRQAKFQACFLRSNLSMEEIHVIGYERAAQIPRPILTFCAFFS